MKTIEKFYQTPIKEVSESLELKRNKFNFLLDFENIILKDLELLILESRNEKVNQSLNKSNFYELDETTTVID